MTGLGDMNDDELRHALGELGQSLAYPSEPRVARAVDIRLRAEAGAGFGPPEGVRPRGRPAWRPTWTRRQLVGLALGVAFALLVTVSASPSARHAVANWLGLRGVDIDYGAPDPVAGASLDLGERVALAEARTRAGFPLLLPPENQTGLPDEVYVSPTPAGGRVSLLWRGNERLARLPGSDVGLLLTQFRASVDDVLVRKLVHGGVRVAEVRVAGERGFWFEGEPHQLFFSDERGQFFADRSRLAGNTLVWERGDLTLRLESALSRDEAIGLAESLRI